MTCDERVTTSNNPELYTSGICEWCGTGRGTRIGHAVRRLGEPTSHDVVYTRNGIMILLLMSEKLRVALLASGLLAEDFAPAIDGAGRPFFELRTERRKVPWVGLNERVGIKAKAVCCPECGAQSFVFAHRKYPKGTLAYVRGSAVQDLKSNIVVAGIAGAPQPLLNGAAYTELLRTRGLDGLKFEPVGVVTDSDIEEPVIGTPVPARQRN